jgi:hypothetical protein
MFKGKIYDDIYWTLTSLRWVIWNNFSAKWISAHASAGRSHRIFRTRDTESLCLIDMGKSPDFGYIQRAYRNGDNSWIFADIQPTGLAGRIFSAVYNPEDNYLYAMVQTDTTVYCRVNMDLASPAWEIIATGTADVGITSSVQLDYSKKFVVALHRSGPQADYGRFYVDNQPYNSYQILMAGDYRFPLFCLWDKKIFGGANGYATPSISIVDQIGPITCRARAVGTYEATVAEGYTYDGQYLYFGMANNNESQSCTLMSYAVSDGGIDSQLYPLIAAGNDIFWGQDEVRNWVAVNHEYFSFIGTNHVHQYGTMVEYRFGGKYRPNTFVYRQRLTTDMPMVKNLVNQTEPIVSCGNTDTDMIICGAMGAGYVVGLN